MDVIFLVQSKAYPNILLYKKKNCYMNITEVDFKGFDHVIFFFLTKESNRAHLELKLKLTVPFNIEFQ